MNKKLIAIAVASAMSVPAAVTVMAPTTAQADGSGPTLYGRVRLGLELNDTDGADENLGFRNGSSRFGIKGDEDLGNGLSAIYRYEFGVDSTEADIQDNNRKSWVGLKGGFGKLTIGKQISNFYELVGTSYALGQIYTGNYLFTDAYGGGPRVGDSLKYQFSSGPIVAGVDMQFNPDDDAGEDLDAWALAGGYHGEAFRVDLGYASSDGFSVDEDDVETDEEYTSYAIAVSSQIAGHTVYAMWDRAEDEAADTEQDGYHVGVAGRSGDTGYFLSYDDLEDEASIWTTGATQYLSDRTKVFLEIEVKDADTEADADRNRYIVGVRHDF